MAMISPVSLDAQISNARFQALQNQVSQLAAKAEGASTKGTGKAEKEARLLKASQEFESIFINFLFERMRAAAPKSGFLDSSREHEIFTSMQDQELSRQMAAAGGLGISKMLFNQLKKTL